MPKIVSDIPDTEQVSELLDIMVGYQRSKVLFALVELGIPTILSAQNLSASAVAEKLGINVLAAERFLNSSVALGLLQRKNDLFSNAAMTENFLVKGKEFYLGGQAGRYDKRSYPAWADLTEKLKNWEYGKTAEEIPEDADQGAEALAEQHNLSLLHGLKLAKAFDFSRYKKVLDLGGGTGAMSIGLCRTQPKLEALVFELERNVRTAARFVKKAGLENRIECAAGDFQKDDLPDGFDLALLANFMAVTDAETNKKLLARIYEKLPPGGVCLISGWIIDDSHLAPEISVLFCLEDICWDAPDVERGETTYAGWLAAAGFKNIECRTYLAPTKMLYGFK